MSRSGEEPIRLGAFEFQPFRRSLKGDQAEVDLSPLATRFLSRLVAAGGEVVTRSELIDHLWDGNVLVGESALNRLTSETRRAAAAAGDGMLIETVQKRGYRIAGPGVADGAQPRSTRRPLLVAAGALAAFMLVAGALHWLMETAIGLIWVANHSN